MRNPIKEPSIRLAHLRCPSGARKFVCAVAVFGFSAFGEVSAADQAAQVESAESRSAYTEGPEVTMNSAFKEVFDSMEQRRGASRLQSSAVKTEGRSREAGPDRTAPITRKPLEEFVSVPSVEELVPQQHATPMPERLSALNSSEASFLNKCRALRDMREGGATAEETAALLSFITTKTPVKDGKQDLNLLALKNDALVCLIQADPLPDDLGRVMLAMVLDETEGPVWREYVLQYVGMYYRAKWPSGSNTLGKDGNRAERMAIQRALAAAVFHEDSGLAGTALIVVEDLAADYPEFQGGVLARGARHLAKAKNTCLASRVTAVSMLSEGPSDDDVSIAADLASNSGEPLSVRLAATGRLAQWSKSRPEAKRKLESLGASDDASKATQRLKEIANKTLGDTATERPELTVETSGGKNQ